MKFKPGQRIRCTTRFWFPLNGEIIKPTPFYKRLYTVENYVVDDPGFLYVRELNSFSSNGNRVPWDEKMFEPANR